MVMMINRCTMKNQQNKFLSTFCNVSEFKAFIRHYIYTRNILFFPLKFQINQCM